MHYYNVKPLKDLSIDNDILKNLCTEIKEIIRKFKEESPQAYLGSIDRRFNSVKEFIKMLEINNIECKDVQDAL